jgi:hypothetical protein
MPSVLHEALVALFRNRPTLAAELLTDALGAQLPHYTSARVESADLSQTVSVSYQADLVVLLLDGVPVLAIIVEVQLREDARKRSSWPVYVAALRRQLGCPAWLFVVTPDETVAAWASQPIELGHPGFVLIPSVLSPASIPYVLDPELAARDPELAVLSAMAHGRGDPARAAEVAITAIGAVARLDEDPGTLYYDLVINALGPAAKAALEELMNSGHYEYQSDFARKYVAQGRAEGKAEGEAKGKAEGEAKGEAKGKAEAVLAVLGARNIDVPAATRERLLACTDLATLDRWLVVAVTASSVDEF